MVLALRNTLGGCLFALLGNLVLLWVSLFQIGPLLWLYTLFPSIFRHLADAACEIGTSTCGYISEIMYGIEFKVFGDPINLSEDSIIIMNHRTCFDWLFFENVVLRYGFLRDLKILQKDVLKKVPGAGWMCQTVGHYYIRRSLERDVPYLKEMISQNLAYASGRSISTLIYPEGTSFCPETLAKSHRFGDKSGLPRYQHVLHPRTAGFIHFVKSLRQRGRLDAVYDVTVAYSGPIPEVELDIFKGKIPYVVSFYVNRIVPTEVPADEEGIVGWLNRLWGDKERILSEFQECGTFPRPCACEPLPWGYHIVAVGTILLSLYSLALCLTSVWMALYCVLVSVIFISVQYKYSGWDGLSLAMHSRTPS